VKRIDGKGTTANECTGSGEKRLDLRMEAADAILYALNDYPVEVWGGALGFAVASLFQSKLDAAEIAQEEKARREEA